MKYRRFLIFFFVFCICFFSIKWGVPYYIKQALIHWYPEITDTYIFASDTLFPSNQPDTWNTSTNYNQYVLNQEEESYLNKLQTVSFLVTEKDSILFEAYLDNWNQNKLSNIFSASKSVIAMLVGIAITDGYIDNVDESVITYLPEWKDKIASKLTIRDLLTMSSGLSWDESYTALVSRTTQAYYGDNIIETALNQTQESEPGVRFCYQSGDTQLLALIVQRSLIAKGNKMSIIQYMDQRLWQPLRMNNMALWNLDHPGGFPKAYCCLNTTVRDLARIGRLLNHYGNWEGQQLIDSAYVNQMLMPASYLLGENDRPNMNYYGYQIWFLYRDGHRIPYFRGLYGQYLYLIEEKDATILRFGHKRSTVMVEDHPEDADYFLDLGLRILDHNTQN